MPPLRIVVGFDYANGLGLRINRIGRCKWGGPAGLARTIQGPMHRQVLQKLYLPVPRCLLKPTGAECVGVFGCCSNTTEASLMSHTPAQPLPG